MSNMQQLELAFEEYSQFHGITLKLNEEGVAGIKVDKVPLFLRSTDGQALFIIASLAKCDMLSEEQKQNLLCELLDINCFYAGVGDGVLGKPKDIDEIIYTQTLPVDDKLTGRVLHETFVKFAESAKSLQHHLHEVLFTEKAQDGSSDPFAVFV